MRTIRATIENGEILLQAPLPVTTGRVPALLVIEDGCAEAPFGGIGLRDFFGDFIDDGIDWERYFSPVHSHRRS